MINRYIDSRINYNKWLIDRNDKHCLFISVREGIATKTITRYF